MVRARALASTGTRQEHPVAILDANLLFTTSSGQAVTSATTTNSTDTIDLGPLTAPNASGGSNTFRDIGAGEDIYLIGYLITGSVTTVTSPTVRFDLQTADDTGFSTNASVIATGTAVALPITTALAAAGQVMWQARLPSANFRRYLRCQIVTAGTITTASYTFVVGLAKSPDTFRAYADGITIS